MVVTVEHCLKETFRLGVAISQGEWMGGGKEPERAKECAKKRGRQLYKRAELVDKFELVAYIKNGFPKL